MVSDSHRADGTGVQARVSLGNRFIGRVVVVVSKSRQADGTGVRTKVSVGNRFIERVIMVADSRRANGTVAMSGVHREGT